MASTVDTAAPEDPYALSRGAIEAPPASLVSALRRIGPGIVLAASIVGSGELIATTTLGAQVGYAGLWIVLVSCAIKPVVQGELGRYTILTGKTGLEGFHGVPGPRVGVGWLVWAWGLTVSLTLLQVGGMYGGVGQVLHALWPALSVNVWVGICLAITLAVLLGGGYARIERFAMVKVGLFTMLTMFAVAVLSQIYTQTLGDWALWLFYLCVVVTLYGTIFASTAAHSRMMADLVRVAGLYRREDAERRLQWRNRFVVVLASVPVLLYWFF